METHDTHIEGSPEERAKKILAALIEGGLSAELAESIRAWYAEDEDRAVKDESLNELLEQHVGEEAPDDKAYAMLSDIRKKLGFDAATTVPATPATPAARPVPKKIPFYRRAAFRVAAVLLPFAVVGALLVRNHHTTAPITTTGTTIAVTDQNKKHIVLPDGSEVWLTRTSELSYSDNFTDDRTVTLNGEAYFSVVPQSGARFVVRTKSVSVTVLGTEFNVRSFDDSPGAAVTLARGSVEVDADGRKYMLTPMEQLDYNAPAGEAAIRRVTEDELWDLRRDNLISFDSDNLEEVFRRISKHYGVDIVLTAPLPGHKLIRVEFLESDRLEDVLSILRLTTENSFNYTIQTDRVVITPAY